MTKPNRTSSNELPSIGKLIKSTILAILIATILLVTVILPAEYGLDPLGVGQLLGLTEMGTIKASLAQEATLETEPEESAASRAIENAVADTETPDPGPSDNVVNRSDQVSFTLTPNEGKEIKLTMVKGAEVNFVWSTDGAKANFDTHADSKPLEIKYHNYEKGKLSRSEGVLTAEFDGNHGWFWRNRNAEDLTVTLQVDGAYSEVVQY